ncbi:Winged helix-turn-helix DNA-binding [Lihuaxuella thermophila]|uniref:Winged helix-turn-helix DNA-binding n=2 Tax=Lihuaxuella thermophila TaxID=1173111 RepID=A0A1H8FVU8_9BACL|nr:Winged helix-turn-helix DNA-binding [Lihuaxuella thermophila]
MVVLKEFDIWREVVLKLEQGATQAELAKQLGLTRGQFRYRLRKFLEQVSAEPEAAAAVEAVEMVPEPTEIFHDPALWDESWSRKWNRNRLVLMVKDTSTLFAYWEVQEQRKAIICEHFESDWNELPFYLQVYDVTDVWFDGYNAHSVHRFRTHPEADHWYIHSLSPGRKYLADWGTTSLSGQFFAILRSNVVETPRLEQVPQNQAPICFGSLHSAPTATRSAFPQPTTPFSVQFITDKHSWIESFDGYTLKEKEND